MADVVATLRGWSATESSNLPAGTTTIGTGLDDNLRQIQATVRKYLASTASNMASASTVDLSTADGYYIQITGTTTITALGTESAGIQYLLRFAGALTLTYNATSLILPGAASITTAAGDMALMISEGSGNWRCVQYSRASGTSAIDPSTITSLTALTSINGGAIAGFRNRIINGDMRIAQRVQQASTVVAFTAATLPWANGDDAYTLDRWYILSDGNDIIDVTQETSVVPTNGLYAMTLDVETINKKFGIAQIIEQQNCTGLIGETVTLSFKAKVSSTTKLDNVKCAIVAWSGTADTVTSDIVSAWGAEGTNPTLIANATYENTPANLSVTTSWATYSVSAAVDTASAKNIIVFIWSDVTDTTLGDFLHVTDVQLECGSAASAFERRPVQTELALCQRYFERLGKHDGAVNLAVRTLINYDVEVKGHTSWIPYMVPKRSYPTVTVYGFGGVTSGQVEYVAVGSSGTNVATAVPSANPYTEQGFSIHLAGNRAGYVNIYSPSNANSEL